MKEIKFEHVLPEVFARQGDVSSEVWQQTVTFEKGGLYLVLAESGKGKSTFCSYILGYRHDYSGIVSFDRKDIRQLRVMQWVDMRQKHISHLFQELRLFPELTAYENVEIKNRLTDWKSKSEIEQWFERLGIADKLHVPVGLLSFGQQQRVAMMRALVQPFDFLLADEPVSHLDDANGKVMGEIMMEEAVRQKAGVIVTSIGKHFPLDYQKTYHL